MTELEKLLTLPSPADLGPGPRAGVLTDAAIRQAAETIVPEGRRGETLLALLLLWHDHHETAHAIVQDLEDADGSYVHAILHRREPDYGNAKYWLRRVGQHPAYGELGRRVSALLSGPEHKQLAGALAPGDRWDAMAMVDACQKAEGRSGDESILQKVQHLEFLVLGECLAGPS
jgi:hypothetical protein